METFAASFLLGLGSAASPCLLPLYPGFIAYLAGRHPALAHSAAGMLLGVAVLAGILTTMIVVGGALSVIALPFTDVLRWSVPIATVILVLLGLLLLAGRNPFNRLGSFPVPLVRNPLGQAYVYGLLVGPIALPCAGPFLVALLAISVGLGDAIVRIASFAIYGLGFGLPLVVLAAISGTRSQAISTFLARRHAVVNRIAGVLLIGTAMYEFLAARPF